MKKILALLISFVMVITVVAAAPISAAELDDNAVSTPSSDIVNGKHGLYVHAVQGVDDTEAWQLWQSKHDEDFYEANPNEKYFFLPTSADDSTVEIYNSYLYSVTVNNVTIPKRSTATVPYKIGEKYSVRAGIDATTLIFMKSTAEAAIYVNNSNADGNGTDLMSYLNVDKSRSAPATGAIVDASGNVDNTTIKKIKGRGNTTWGKPKKAYNITYDSNVTIAGMPKSKKYSILANYQDDSLSRNRFLYDLSDAVGMPYASDSRYVDFYVNGFYWGSYQMTEKIEVGKNNVVNDIDDKAYLKEDGTVSEDFPFLVEVDAGANENEDFVVKCNNNIRLTVKAPDLTPEDIGYDEVKDYIRDKYNEFADAAKSTTSDLSQYADIDSITKLYLINELGKNWDSGVSSTYFVYKQDKDGSYKFFGSPVWDYDNSLGNATGVAWDLNRFGVTDYEEYTGWWCKFKDKEKKARNIYNIINNISRHNQVLDAAPQIWFEKFMPAINYFSGKTLYSNTSDEFYSAKGYYSLIKGSAEMNYTSGWLLDTGDWICDHSGIKKAYFDVKTGVYTADSSYTYYDDDFDGMYNYCVDWLTSRAAWLSDQMFASYTPPTKLMGDVDGNGIVNVLDATEVQKYVAQLVSLTDEQLEVADLNGDGSINVLDATEIQKIVAEI